MRICIAGASGFLGRPLVAALVAEGHTVTVLSRRPGPAQGPVRTEAWTPNGSTGPWTTHLAGCDAVINLAGEPIAGKRWTAEQKSRITRSRVDATRSLATAIAEASAPPPVFISGSAVGYYGPCGPERVTESAPAGTDFLADVCVAWEREALAARSPRTRVVTLRTGLVLGPNGGALQPMLLPFRLGAGGPLGSGQQFWPWIHLDDWVALVRWTLTTVINGAVNASAPEPVTNADFTRALGRAVHRPAIIPAPAFALRLALGEMADALLLSGQRAVPAAALAAGFTFTYTDLDTALSTILS